MQDPPTEQPTFPTWSSPDFWGALTVYVDMRRDAFYTHIYDNRATIEFDDRYIELFYNELDIAYTIQGLQRTVAPLITCLSIPLAKITRRLHLYKKDADLWAALKVGCFLDDRNMQTKAKYTTLNWWLPQFQKHSVQTVVAEFQVSLKHWAEEDFIFKEGSTGGQVDRLLSILLRTCDQMDEDLVVSREYLRDAKKSMESITLVHEKLRAILYK
ncbi:hypothetical protein DFP72DRAFT_850111 [Ephemerocybe angulata]|uniref:Uncharacterized protein n=1 Tax=Ephemerocybe angulata TaxID=980116 RepID=A0A8H6HT40_9AGAR|nr:hypothetical protein DFP72DRAFT_850111 [Tulosesus angulatus]